MGDALFLKAALGNGQLFVNEPMINHTTFKIGGIADFVALPQNEIELIKTLKACKELGKPYFIIGNGSNILVCDEGFRGVVIKLFKNFADVSVVGSVITAKAGTLLSTLAATAYAASLSGLEFAAGIPGTVGGAVLMNAGAYGGEMSDVVIETQYIDKNFDICTVKEHGFSYRNSAFQKNKGIIIKTKLNLKLGNKDEIKEKMDCFTEKRKAHQPLNMPSAGSAFKRPQGGFAAKFIDDAGLRGFTVGGAQVSTKHTGFIVNKGGATAQDVIKLMKQISDTVYEKFGVVLESEIKLLK